MTSRETKSPRRRAEKSGAAKTPVSDDSREPPATAPEGEGPRGAAQGVVEALREANRKLEAIIAASPLAIVTLDEEGRVESWSAAAERIFGWREVEVLGEPLPTVPPELRAEVARNHADAVAGKAFSNFETRRQRKDGAPVDVSISTAPLADAAGNSRGVVALVADVTGRKRAEEALRVSETRFRTLVEQSPLSKQILSTDGRTVEVNRAWEKLWGVTLADLPDYNILEDEQLAEKGVTPYIKRAFAGEAVEIPEIGYMPDRGEFAGQERWVRARAYPVKDDAGVVREVVLVHEDVTERRRAESSLRQFAAIVENSDDAIISKDLDGTILSWNPGAERLYGYTAAEAIGQPVTMLIPPDRPDEEPHIIEQIKRGQPVEHYETVRLRKDGTLIHVSLTVSPMRNADGRVTGASKIARDITERRRAEDEKLRLGAQVEGERRRLRDLVANVPGVVWEAWGVPDEGSQRIDFVSDYVEQMLGYTVEEWLATPNFWLTIVHPEDRERAAREARAMFDSRAGGVSRFRWVTKDGREIEVEAQSVVICDERGEPAGLRGVTMDITERVRSEEALRQSEERYRAFVTQSSEAIWRFELDVPLPVDLPVDAQIDHFYAHARLAECNDVMARMYGFARAEEIEGARLQEMIPRNEANVEYLRGAIRSGYRMIDAESEERDRDGNTKYFLNNLVGIVEGGMLLRVWGTQRDVTARRRAEEEQKFLSDATTILASSLNYEATLDAVAHMSAAYLADYCLVDLLEDDGAIRRLVAAHRQPAREAAWREMQRRFPIVSDPQHTVHKVLQTGEPDLFTEMTGEVLARAIPSPAQVEELERLGVCSAMTVPLRARGRTVGAISFISAESGRRYRERELRLAEELARRAALAVDNARLYERAQEANRAKDEFLATLSHELRTPLTPIVGWVHLLGGDDAATPDLRHGLAVIDKNSQALSHLINDLLDMSAIMNGKMRIDRLPVEIDSVLREAVETVRAQADKRGVEIEISPCAGGGPAVEGDRTRLVQVFWNLLSNAVKFSPDGGRVRVSCDLDAGGLRVRVEDEGVGISQEFLPHVFERFRQADMSPTKLYGGLGIGLSLVHSFVEAHGGEVAAESEGEGRGSRFTVSLPLRNADFGLRVEENRTLIEEAAPAIREVTPAPQPPAPPLAPDGLRVDASNPQSETRIPPSARRVLVVEDAPDTLEMLRLFFGARGYAPTACASAEDALDVAARGHFDIIVTDIGLPNIDGYELLRRMRSESPHLADTPAIALTGYAAEADVTAARAAGFDAHVAKPFEPEALGEAIEKLLASRAADGERAAPR
ncbi:MAG TPA: PAS domain S-box protein [Pyrinomonadaceae bacterium]|jgi:PAS domain S-box-containing protein|nr:PAS domain S-box protein [Pyrinomonadaceae bacterium]